MRHILLSGANGRMGKVLQHMIAGHAEFVISAGLDRHTEATGDFPIYSAPEAVKEPDDLVIDFSHHSNVAGLLDFCVANQLPIVVATTGLSQATQEKMVAAAQKIPVFYSANMSVGINVLIKALKAITPPLEADFDIEIIEKHHNQKIDAPSGTALLLADSINESCQEPKEYLYGRSGNDLTNDRKQLGIHAVRGGTIPGEHTVIYAGADEIIELKHTALSRDIFANGALKAAEYLAKQPAGLYDMENLLDK